MWTATHKWTTHAILLWFQYSLWEPSHTSHDTFNLDSLMSLPSYTYSCRCMSGSVCFLLLQRAKTDDVWTVPGGHSLMFSVFVCSSRVPWHLLTVHGTSPHSIHLSDPQGLWLHLMSFQVASPDNTNYQNTQVHKPRLQPSGYALVNLFITLKPQALLLSRHKHTTHTAKIINTE